MSKTKILFNIINTTFIVLYVYPGSILGFLIHGELHKQPQLTPDFISISSNHLYAFLVLSLLGLIAYYKGKKLFILNYLILGSIILEVLQGGVTSYRTASYLDILANSIGIILAVLAFLLFEKKIRIN